MMTPSKNLSALLHARYQREQSAFMAVVAKEKQIRQNLLQLSDFERKAREDLDIDPTPLVIGADSLWQDWLGRRRSELNIRLANVLARKADSRAQLRLAFGRKTVSDELTRGELTTTKQRFTKENQDLLLRFTLFESRH